MDKERVSNKADKNRFGPELTEAEINALVDNTSPGNIMEFLTYWKDYSSQACCII